MWKCQKDDYRLYKVKLVNIVMNWENDNYMNIRVKMGIDELSVSPSMVLGVRSRICEME